MPRNERKIRFRPARARSAARTALSPSGASRWRGSRSRIASGTVSATSASSEGRPRSASISRTSSSEGPMWRRGKVSPGSSMALADEAPFRTDVFPADGGSFGTRMSILLLRLALHERLVGLRVHQAGHRGGIGELDLDHPGRAMGIRVDDLGLVDEAGVHLGHRAGHRRVELGDRLDRLHRSEYLVRGDGAPHLGELQEHDVTELLLRVVRDPDHAERALDADPLVLLRIAAVCP